MINPPTSDVRQNPSSSFESTRWAATAVVVLVVLVPRTASADVITLGAIKDNTIFQSTGALSNGAGDFFFAGNNANNLARRALVAFDVAGTIPAGVTIQSVTLTLSMSRTISGLEPVGIRRVLRDWGEGTSDGGHQEGIGGPATPGDATWFHTFYSSLFWTNPGGDFSVVRSATTDIDGIAFYSWSSQQLRADVQFWLDNPAANFGWILRGNEAEAASAKRFDSRSHPTPGRRPALVVQFSGSVAVRPGTWGRIKAMY